MRKEQGTWDDISVDAVLFDPVTERAARVIAAKQGWFRVQYSDGSTADLPPQPAETEMTFLIPSDGELAALLSEELGAQQLDLLQALATQPARAARMAHTFPPRRGKNMHRAVSHIELMHNVHVRDVKTMAGLHEAHDALHADPNHLMRYAHHHPPED